MGRMRLATYLTNEYQNRLHHNYRYSQKQFAKDLNIKRENLTGYMNPRKGDRQPRIDQCVNMAKGLGLTLIEFLVESGLATIDEADQVKKPGIPEDLPEPVRIAMSTPHWKKLCICEDEIETLCSFPDLTDPQRVIEAVNRLSWRVIKQLFLEHHAPLPVQDDCVRHCKLIVSDWAQHSASPASA